METQKEIYLTVEGEAGQEIQIWYRGDRDYDYDNPAAENPAPIIVTGKLGADGKLTVRVPCAGLCVGFPERRECQPLLLKHEDGDSATFSLRSEKPDETHTDSKTDSDSDDERVKISADHDFAAQDEIASAGAHADAGNFEGIQSAALLPWRVAKSLLTLRDQINQRAPNRNKASDGTIGDEAHRTRNSDHNPWIRDGANDVVSAMDITHDPAHGCDARIISEAIRTNRDPRVKYLIWNRRICNSSPIGGSAAWTWRTYSGSNGHTHHIHISVKSEKASYDSTTLWSI